MHNLVSLRTFNIVQSVLRTSGKWQNLSSWFTGHLFPSLFYYPFEGSLFQKSIFLSFSPCSQVLRKNLVPLICDVSVNQGCRTVRWHQESGCIRFILGRYASGACVRSPVRLFVTPWTVPHQNPLSMEFSRRILEWVAMPLLQGIFPTQGLNLHVLLSPALAGRFFTTSTTWVSWLPAKWGIMKE